jgi:non-ribosomal peptide synthetase component F
MLYRYTGQGEIVIGTPIAGRTRKEIEGLIGFFVNSLVIKTEVRGEMSFVEMLRKVKEVALSAYAHQEMPFEKLVEELGEERETSRHPIFQVMFGMTNTPLPALEVPGLNIVPFKVEIETSKVDLAVNVSEKGPTFVTSFVYNTDLFDESTITRMMDHYRNLMREAVADPNLRLIDIPVSADESKMFIGYTNTVTDHYAPEQFDF